MRENHLWYWLRDGWKGVEGLHCQRIETSTGRGVPDVEVCHLGRSFWVELKACPDPGDRLARLKAKATAAQGVWHRRRLDAGGRTFMLVGVSALSKRRTYLVPGVLLAKLGSSRREPWIRISPGTYTLTEADLEAAALTVPPDATPRDLLDVMTAG